MIRPRILVVDDDADILLACAEGLPAYGYEVMTISRGEQALQILKTRSFDAVILDWFLPGMDGTEVLKKIRHEIAPEVPVLMLTAFGSLESCVEHLRLGASGYLAKPFNIGELARELARLLGRKEYGRPLLSREKGEPLSEQEKKVLLGLREGLTDKAIAERLGISVRTVNNHVYRIMRKLNASTRAEIVSLSFRRKIV
ncbi:MAG TPA: response regulator transcription factor [Armatimonadetes bacterium]|nr:response regulator transcription factor [Armatimonadota bacterium]